MTAFWSKTTLSLYRSTSDGVWDAIAEAGIVRVAEVGRGW